MVRQHPGAPATVTCIWPASPDINDEIGQHLICWAGSANVTVRTIPTFHYEVPKALCVTNGPLVFTEGGPDQCPIGDDLTISAADPLDPQTCQYEPPPGSTPATWEDNNVFTAVNTFQGHVIINDDLDVTGNVGIIGNTTHTGNVTINSGTLTTGPIITTGTITNNGETNLNETLRINQPNAATQGAIITQANTVTASDANMGELWYMGFNTRRDTEIGMLRVITPPASTGLGKEGEVTAQFHAGTPTTPALRIHNSNGTATVIILGNGTATFTGNVEAPNTTRGAWLPITVDSPTVIGRYTAGSGVTQYVPAARIEGGDTVRLSGIINIGTASVAGDVMASAMPTGTFPAKEVNILGGSGGAAAMIRVSAAGVLTIQRTAQTGSISLDGISYRLS